MSSKVKAVKYIGVADILRIRREHWEAAGVKDQGGVTWKAENGFTVLADKLSPSAIAYCDRGDDSLVIIRDGEDESKIVVPPDRSLEQPKTVKVVDPPEEERTTA